MNQISLKDARRLFLSSQGLLRNGQFGRGKQAALRAIEQLGYVQIDTISVLDRAHHHVLKTRVPNYTETMLDRLQAQDRKVFEYWAHAAAYLPMCDYRYYLPMMAGRRETTDALGAESGPHHDNRLAAEIIARIRTDGPLSSRHFDDPGGRKSSGWWDWKPAKLALESLFLRGELMITRRDGFQKVYDLAENVLPADLDVSMPSRDEWCRFIVTRGVRSLGAATAMDIGYARSTIRRFTGTPIQGDIVRTIHEMAAEGSLVSFRIGKETFFSTPSTLERLPVRFGKRQLWLLSPFDNLVINRRRAQILFDFDYQIECYVPEAKRQYGYYCLPILWGDELIGRLDARAIRASATLEVHLLHLEPRTRVDDALMTALAESLDKLASANGCQEVRLARTDPAKLKQTVEARLS